MKRIRSDRAFACQLVWAIGAIVCSAQTGLAQNITLDGTLGPAGTLAGPDYVILQSVGTTIDRNLFHSFGRFNLGAREAAIFQSAANIRNILARVTGERSLINGEIFTTSGNVNLFLINPRGIVFGPNARLDIGGTNRGSFVATTVDAIAFPNGGQFSATNPGSANSLLTIKGDPSGFLASQRVPPPIDIIGSNLQTYPRQSLLFLGGDVALDAAQLQVPGGRIELGGLAGAGEVALVPAGNGLGLQFPDRVLRGDIAIGNGSEISVLTNTGGSIHLTARNIGISGASSLLAGIGSGLGNENSQAGDIILNATGTIDLANSQIRNNLEFGATGRGGNVALTADTLNLTDGAIVSASTAGQGDAGNLTITTSNAVTIENSVIGSVLGLSNGNGGTVELTTGTLRLSNSGQINTSNGFGIGNGGNIFIQADRILMDGNSNQPSSFTGIGSVVIGVGRGGEIQIETGSLESINGAQINTQTIGQAIAGNITIRARDAITFDGARNLELPNGQQELTLGGVLSTLISGVGQSGDIQITAGSLNLTNGAQINASTLGTGDAGNVTIQVRHRMFLKGSDSLPSTVGTAVGDQAIGKGGNIQITTGSLTLAENSIFASATTGQGDAGNITIQAQDAVSLTGSPGKPTGIFTTTFITGQGGAITIETGSFSLQNDAFLFSSTLGLSNSGDITVRARDNITLRGGNIFAPTLGAGNAGNITLQAGDRIRLQNGTISSGTFPVSLIFRLAEQSGATIPLTPEQLAVLPIFLNLIGLNPGDAGAIRMTARSIELDQGTQVSTTSFSGDGGDIQLQAEELLLLRRNSVISTQAGAANLTIGNFGFPGTGGSITIDAPFVVSAPLENSDITANAFEGSGGRLTINAQGIYWLTPRSRAELQQLLGTSNPFELDPQKLPTNDVTSFSQTNPAFADQVFINTLDIDPSRGLVELGGNLVDPSRLLANRCPARGETGSSFYITGRGGIPERPGDLPISSYATGTVRSLPSSSQTSAPAVSPVASEPAPRIVEAQGWIKKPNGDIYLVAHTDREAKILPPIECPEATDRD